MNKKVKIFSADYLMNNELTDEDLKTLLGDHQLIYSLIVEMFKISKHTLSENEIIDNNFNNPKNTFDNNTQQEGGGQTKTLTERKTDKTQSNNSQPRTSLSNSSTSTNRSYKK